MLFSRAVYFALDRQIWSIHSFFEYLLFILIIELQNRIWDYDKKSVI